MKEIQDYEASFKIEKDYGIGVKYIDTNGNQFISVCNKKFPREAILEISSYVGISAGAVHDYGLIEVRNCGAKLIKKAGKGIYPDVKEGTIFSYYSDGAPDEVQGIRVYLTRPVTKKDLQNKNGIDFECYHIGDRTYRFHNCKKLISRAQVVFRKFFGKGWRLILSDDVLKKDKDGEYWDKRWITIATNK